MRPEDLTLENTPGAQSQRQLMRGVYYGSPTEGYTANGQTIEQKRGSMLKKRLDLINDFLFEEKGTEKTFGEYISEKGINEKVFLSELPMSLKIDGISKATAESENLFDYANTLNLWYADQFLKHHIKTGIIEVEKYHNADSEYHEAKGKLIKKIKDKIKNAKDKVKESVSNTTNKIKDKVKRLGVIGTINKTNPALVIVRNSFLSLLDINAAGMASTFNYIKKDNGKHWAKFIKRWRIIGGDDDRLKNAIDRGAKKKPFPPLKRLFHHNDGENQEIDTNNPKNAGKTAAATAGALTGLAGILASNPATAPAAAYVGSAGSVMAMASPIFKSFAKENGEDTSSIPDVPDTTNSIDPDTKEALKTVDEGENNGDDGFFSQYKWYLVGGFTVAALLGLIFLGGKKK